MSEQLTPSLDFGGALSMLRQGHKVARKGWNGKDQYVFQAHIDDFATSTNIMSESLKTAKRLPCFAIKTTGNEIQFGWLATQSDMHSDDWYVVES